METGQVRETGTDRKKKKRKKIKRALKWISI